MKRFISIIAGCLILTFVMGAFSSCGDSPETDSFYSQTVTVSGNLDETTVSGNVDQNESDGRPNNEAVESSQKQEDTYDNSEDKNITPLD